MKLTLQFGGSNNQLWFMRTGQTRFKTELMCISYGGPSTGRLFVDFYGSPLGPDDLASQGARSNVAGTNLFNFQFYAKKKDPTMILPQAIDWTSGENSWLHSLEAEIIDVTDDVWLHLWCSSLENDADWIDAK